MMGVDTGGCDGQGEVVPGRYKNKIRFRVKRRSSCKTYEPPGDRDTKHLDTYETLT